MNKDFPLNLMKKAYYIDSIKLNNENLLNSWNKVKEKYFTKKYIQILEGIYKYDKSLEELSKELNINKHRVKQISVLGVSKIRKNNDLRYFLRAAESSNE